MAEGANSVPELGFSWRILLTLLLVLGVSVAVFVWQVRRWTTHRGWRALLDWSRERGFRLSRPDAPAGEPFERLTPTRVTTRLESGKTQAFQMLLGAEAQPSRWHVLVRQIAAHWPPTALRPANVQVSLVDQFSLSGYPRMGEVERFVVFGTDSEAARALSQSHARALLPPDIGLLLHGRHMVLDFSARPFDGIELGRMVALADQLEQHLPIA
ncbi:hypothetical protein BH20VER1_BH20VER1_31710 [soil metagenome]